MEKKVYYKNVSNGSIVTTKHGLIGQGWIIQNPDKSNSIIKRNMNDDYLKEVDEEDALEWAKSNSSPADTLKKWGIATIEKDADKAKSKVKPVAGGGANS